MKILGISCGRKNGNSELLLKLALKSAKNDSNADIEYLRLQDMKINPCTGCELCSNSDNWPDGKFPESGYFCHYPKDSDHLIYILDKVREADAIIISTPVYHLTIPGILLSLLNRIHCVGMARHMETAAKIKTVCATIAVGGSDMTNLVRPLLNFTAVELCGSQMNLVDQMTVQFCAPVKYVTLRNDAQERALQLGRHVALALAEYRKSGNIMYFGKEDNPELCPVCHGDIVQLAGNRFRCPVCNILGDIETGGDGIRINWDGDADQSRMNENEKEDEVRIKQRTPYSEVRNNRERVNSMVKEFSSVLEPLPIPPLKP